MDKRLGKTPKKNKLLFFGTREQENENTDETMEMINLYLGERSQKKKLVKSHRLEKSLKLNLARY